MVRPVDRQRWFLVPAVARPHLCKRSSTRWLVGILGGDRPLLIIPAVLGNNNHGGITSVAQMALSNIGEQLMEKASLGAGKKGNPFQTYFRKIMNAPSP